MLVGFIVLALASAAAGQICGGDLEGPSGSFNSPNYPQNYPSNINCQWNIKVNTGNQIEVEFQDFVLEGASPIYGCAGRDFITISDGESSYGPYCGYDMPPKVTSAKNELTVIFSTDESLQYRGFLATYKEIVNAPPTTPKPSTRMPPTTNCVTEAKGDSGTLTSPNYPKDYPRKADCSYFITLDSNATVTVNFLDLDIQGGDAKCSEDKLTIHDGPNGNFPVLAKVCGQNATAKIKGSGKQIYMRFETNNGTVGRGFNVSYEITPCAEVGGQCVARSNCTNKEITGHTSTCNAGEVCCSPTPTGPFPTECGKRFNQFEQPSIVGGREAVPNSWPWQVSLQRPPGTFHYCGGVLISDTWVATAAHCVHDEAIVSVVLGEHDRQVESGNEVRILATTIIVHEYFINSSPWPNDIALLKLSEKAPINDKIYPACFPPTDMPLDLDDNCYITGWGDTKNTGDRYLLNELKIAPIPNEVCRASWGASILDTHVCLGDGSAGSCQGDSGGPFVCEKEGKWTLGGVTSWGIRGCRTLGYPPVYTRVPSYRDWVMEKIAENP